MDLTHMGPIDRVAHLLNRRGYREHSQRHVLQRHTMRGVSRMKKLALGALLIGLLAACGGDDGKNGKIMPLDGGADAPSTMTCNPLTQAGCAANEKCTWLIDATMPQYVGHVGCAPDGDVAVDGECTYGAASATGYDNCAKGSVCSQYRTPGNAGVCKQLCDQQGGTPTCDASHVCVTYSQLFST